MRIPGGSLPGAGRGIGVVSYPIRPTAAVRTLGTGCLRPIRLPIIVLADETTRISLDLVKIPT
jgi:hypothetical protein